MTKSWIATPSRTNAILNRYQLDAKKSLGQNFLMEPQILEKMVEAAAIDQDTDVIEIGPGIGALTEFLCESAGRVLAFEVDDRLLPVLEAELGHYDNLTVLHQDILEADLKASVAQYFPDSKRLAVVANLPYYITTPIIFHFLESDLEVSDFALMMQYEVAERLTAQAGTKAYSALTIVLDYYCQSEIAVKVPKTVFKPRPKVDSAVLHLKRRQDPPVKPQNEDLFFKVVKGAFAHRRKTLWNNLKTLFVGQFQEPADLQAAIEAAGIDPKVRAEQLTIEDFSRLSDALNEAGFK
ncbi:16S rRNA (adenine(1518)-N(6)/adenine(1519)-N(6))-dimethyltransferase RsmA [Aerococcus loyolae]|uniref:Ribosomal RNA small subunit methyltransferase A n=1 Tax=Aerococcus loyolae TaxID=2976809 RepID=A0ABT4BZD9_9LACT|nr:MULTISPECIES: 16S rRNA (adenine(1518)-N(6)/adenine(1519)-N(6))-dimethyltransferase RsmA [Aerococcus]MCY3024798.1 16S rRNA (adenine(1518)-N(6)/adenine(1519)-N(6))-dimethyltransferase RsmA [Aerococcus loyolae]MCY3028718.1 16S rRNA (adenine(1518)-N(6)/adenine(1519)-N(6))-dimethyltransferase RsmA [Aerococcus loyolae]MDK7909591.1 16S rRNA (adenine(1518)-N(6)/adenine(1519)-N(6))-dimethyltransferase RsmA [Aerococcus urinae]MDK8609920.1 16S rRNA (adenine(1518)-N(6)/adenine(1519)-N(6))-dimethyltransf